MRSNTMRMTATRQRNQRAQQQRATLDAQRRQQVDDDGDHHRAAEHAGGHARQQPGEPCSLARVVQAHRGHAHEHDSRKQQAVRNHGAGCCDGGTGPLSVNGAV
jgi:hypothetical protein